MVCKINQSAMSTEAANNKIPGITKYNNFSLTSKGMHVWQAYNVGEGTDIEGSWNDQDVSGLERIGEWTKELPCVARTKYQAKGKHNDDAKCVSTFTCLEAACIATFKTKETIYDAVRRQWAAVTTSVRGAGQKIAKTDYVTVANSELSKGRRSKKLQC